jgi:class 3 adenylate cyclase/DNA-binding winged helix-turn-helix (wHTH) protein
VRDGRSGATATILFTDLVGSTRLASTVGDAGFDEFRRAHFAALRGVLCQHGGDEVKTLGDGILAVFSSAADALAAAVAMQQAIDVASHALPAPAALRVGVALGDVAFEDGDVFGTPVVEAARLVAAAQGGQILVTAVVPAVAGSRSTARLKDVGPLRLKGLPEPLSACEVLWEPAGAPPAEHVGVAIGVLGPLVVASKGGLVEVRGSRQRILLGVLVARLGRVVPADQLVDALWGESLPVDPTASLQSQVFRLRRELGPSGVCVERVPPGYRLRAAAEQVDAAAFEALLASDGSTPLWACGEDVPTAKSPTTTPSVPRRCGWRSSGPRQPRRGPTC